MIDVSIICLTYNHKDFIRKALDGFVNQKTNFDYEVIVHDDASTDGTDEVIKEYELAYPQKIKGLYEKENQFSKGMNIVDDIIFPRTKGKYIAFCESDDYWCDEYKLQKQFDFMELHKSCSLCVHNTVIHDLENIDKDKLFFGWKDIHILNESEIFLEWKVHTSSYFFRRESVRYTSVLPKVWCGDYALLVYAFSKGKVIALPDVMSIYNAHNKSGETWKNRNLENKIERNKERANFLRKYNQYTLKKYENVILERIKQIEYENVLLDFEKKMQQKENYKEYKNNANEVLNNTKFSEYINSVCKKEKIKKQLTLHSYFIYKIRNLLR